MIRKHFATACALALGITSASWAGVVIRGDIGANVDIAGWAGAFPYSSSVNWPTQSSPLSVSGGAEDFEGDDDFPYVVSSANANTGALYAYAETSDYGFYGASSDTGYYFEVDADGIYNINFGSQVGAGDAYGQFSVQDVTDSTELYGLDESWDNLPTDGVSTPVYLEEGKLYHLQASILISPGTTQYSYNELYMWFNVSE